MTLFEKTSEIACSAEALFAWHARPGALTRLTPPFEEVRNASEVTALIDGAKATLEMAAGPVWTKWTAHTEQVRQGRGFVDVQERGPFASWRHEHIFEPAGDHCTLTDRIHYELPVGALGRAFGGGIIKRRLERGFAFRHATTKLDFELYASLEGSARPLVVGVTGASGLIGKELATLLSVSGHDVRPFVRGERTGARAVRWDPATGELDASAAEGIDVVVHLAGEPIAEGRLDDAHRQRVRESRVDVTHKLVAALGRLERKPRAFIASSAVGYYGDRGDELLDEDAPRGAGFLAELCEAWEAAARTAEGHGMRWASLRTGIVLSPAGGALAKMLPPFSAGAGAVLGDGTQWAPYLSIDDVGAIYLRAIVDERVRGPVNSVGPALTNREFTSTLAGVLHRPAIARVPKFAARALFGALADEALLVSQRAVPKRLEAWGHRFRHATTVDALRHVLGRVPGLA